MWIFVYLGPYLESRSFQTLYDRVAGQQARLLFQSNTVAPLHHLIKKGIYMLMHVLFGTATMMLASAILFRYQAAVCFTLRSGFFLAFVLFLFARSTVLNVLSTWRS